MGQPGDLDIFASSEGATLALLSKSTMEEILKQSFHPTSLLEKNAHRKLNAFGASPTHLAVRPHQLKTQNKELKTHNSIANVAKVAKAAQPPRLLRELVKRARCAESKQFSEAYIQKNRAQAEATTDNAEVQKIH